MPYKLRINVSIEQVDERGVYLGGGGSSPFQGNVGQLLQLESVRGVLGVVADVEEAVTQIVELANAHGSKR